MSQAYHFRLAAILRLRHAEYEQAELALSLANSRLRSLIAERDAEAARGAELDLASGVQSVKDFLAERTSVGLAAAHLLLLEGRANVAAAEAALSRLSWTAAHRRVNALERLETRRRAEWRADQNRRESLELDELATAAFVRELQSGGVG